jgi:hypothetical protein
MLYDRACRVFVYMDDTQIHLPADEAPYVTGEYASCKVCGCEWQVRADSDKKGCVFCGSGKEAIIVLKED